MAERDDDDHDGDEPARCGTVFGRADLGHATGRVLDADLDQGKANHHHDQPGDQWWQGEAYAADEQSEEGVEEAADDHAAHHGGHGIDPLASDQRDGDRQEGEAGALDDGQSRTDRPDAYRLQERRRTGEQHRHLDHVDEIADPGRAEAETRSTSDDDRRRDVGDEHGEHVLHAQRHRLHQWRQIVGVATLLSGADRGPYCHAAHPYALRGLSNIGVSLRP